MMKRMGAGILALAMLVSVCSLFSMQAAADEPQVAVQTNKTDASADSGSYRAIDFDTYLSQYSSAIRPDTSVSVAVTEYTASATAEARVETLDGRNNVLVTGADGEVTWQFTAPQDGLYNMNFVYYPVKGKGATIERSLLLDGKLPFEEARTLSFLRVWQDEGEKKYDSAGNEFRRNQIEAPEWVAVTVASLNNYMDTPLSFYLTAGVHTLTFRAVSEPMAIAEITFCQAETPRSYAEVYADYQAKGYKEVGVATAQAKVQAEDSLKKSASCLYGLSDRSSPANENYSLTKSVLNTIGGNGWQYQGDWIEWEVNAAEAGLYKLAIRTKQDYKSGSFSTRSLQINGKIPFAEVQGMRISYNRNWQLLVPQDEKGNPYLFYLEKGVNTVRMQVVVGEHSEVLRLVSRSVTELNSAATKITMLTGSFPDPLRDYELKETLPEIFVTFREQIAELEKAGNMLMAYSGDKGETSAALDEMLILLELFMEDARIIPSELSNFKDNISALAAWLLTASEQPLLVDYITFLPPEAKLPRADATFWEKTVAEVKAFFLSFVTDYNNVANIDDGTAFKGEVELWLAGNSGRDQATSIKNLADNYFTPGHQIRLNIRLVDMDVLLRAVSADKGPDVAIFQGQSTPINYALRSALQDLTEFDDLDTVLPRFDDSALVPLQLGDSLYGLPEQQMFMMQFYRKDIFADLGVSVPETWTDFYALIPILQNSNLRIGLPTPFGVTSGGSATQLNSLFNTLLYQNDVSIFTENGDKCLLGELDAIEVFVQWAELYTKYKLDKTINITDYFRTGEAPLVLADYTTYNTLSVSAPEIKGLWGMAPLPGIKQADGTIRRDTGSAITSVIMFANAEDKAASWEFMKWWTSTEAQTLYGREIEAMQGVSARYPTANLESMQQLAWPTEISKALNAQWAFVQGVPEVAGGYYVGRNIDNAIKSVVTENKNAREIILDYVDDINKEITYKRKEFGLE